MMRRIGSRLALAHVLLAAIASLSWPTNVGAKEPRVKGGRLEFALPDLDGKVVATGDERFKGKVVFVTIWGTWCPPCRSEVPTFNELQQRFADRGLEIVAIAFERDGSAEDRRRRLGEFVAAHDIAYLVLDGGSTREFSSALPMVVDVKGLPIEILIDREGTVVASRNGYGYSEKWARELAEELDRLLGAVD